MPGLDPCLTLRQLLMTMRALRAPDGCPWDAAQTPESLAPYILEEACETVEAIETGSAELIADELGDLLLQVVFQAQIFAERGQFDFADVAAGINAKLVRRHPHVFDRGDDPASAVDLDRQWERIKREEQAGRAGPPHPLGQLPGRLPALQRAQKLIARMQRAGLDAGRFLPQGSVAAEPLDEAELAQALLTLVRRAEASGLDAEQALRRATQQIMNTTAEMHRPLTPGRDPTP